MQAYTALLTAAVKGGESDLAVEVYRQMGAEGMARDRQVFAVLVDVHVRQGAMREALQVRQQKLFYNMHFRSTEAAGSTGQTAYKLAGP